MKKILIAAAACAVLGLGGTAAYADDCSGHDHSTGTVLGAAGGAAIGGLASHSIVGAVVGGVAGGFAGNAIDRAQDCDRHEAYDYDRDGDRQAYNDGYRDRAYEERRAYEDRRDYDGDYPD